MRFWRAPLLSRRDPEQRFVTRSCGRKSPSVRAICCARSAAREVSIVRGAVSADHVHSGWWFRPNWRRHRRSWCSVWRRAASRHTSRREASGFASVGSHRDGLECDGRELRAVVLEGSLLRPPDPAARRRPPTQASTPPHSRRKTGSLRAGATGNCGGYAHRATATWGELFAFGGLDVAPTTRRRA